MNDDLVSVTVGDLVKFFKEVWTEEAQSSSCPKCGSFFGLDDPHQPLDARLIEFQKSEVSNKVNDTFGRYCRKCGFSENYKWGPALNWLVQRGPGE